MSVLEANDSGMPGDFLPEGSRLRLEKLRDHVEFLSRLARSRIPGEARDRVPEVSADEFAACLELLAEQVCLVLESRPVPQPVDRCAVERGAVPMTEPEMSDTTDSRFTFGITLDQVDALDRLIQTISAHGDVVAADHAAELANQTLPVLGQAICDGTTAVRSILDEVEAQRLGRAARPRTGVGETRGVYAVEPAFSVDRTWYTTQRTRTHRIDADMGRAVARAWHRHEEASRCGGASVSRYPKIPLAPRRLAAAGGGSPLTCR